MASRKPEDLTPSMFEKWRLFDQKMTAAGIKYILTCTARTDLEQIALYAQGRDSLLDVNRKRSAAGIAPISLAEASRKVTWTLNSRHIVSALHPKSYAFDIAIVKDGKAVWDVKVDVNDNDKPDYEEAGKIGESCGLVWGGRFKCPDLPHFQDSEK